ncbi:AfsR/SARP family transcriptional regulator [Frankia sp. Cr1]|uniref:AfsR/SARP family transcriptional regulator n=1 Tax=Frankia sp. Cr1 TaxID=3073931 RepID=UPI002AD35A0E|nr:AfsR/SARP family transcriptional regulator [Frankia sp. Cr1]
MRYEILGPLRVVGGGGISFISAPKIEILLAALVIRADHVVGTDQLIDEIWGDRAPRRATAGLHVYISELRKFLSRLDHPNNRIVTRQPGYLLNLGSDDMDVQLFLDRVAVGRKQARERCHEEASDRFESALALWRGPALGGLGAGSMIEAFVSSVSESRMECTELLVDSQLQLGRHREVVGRLFSLVTEFPLRETFYRQLMLALYRSERRADALKVYESARRTLHDELGLEPCRALQDIQRAILAGDDRALLDTCAAV